MISRSQGKASAVGEKTPFVVTAEDALPSFALPRPLPLRQLMAGIRRPIVLLDSMLEHGGNRVKDLSLGAVVQRLPGLDAPCLREQGDDFVLCDLTEAAAL
jgi:hypothetical protein